MTSPLTNKIKGAFTVSSPVTMSYALSASYITTGSWANTTSNRFGTTITWSQQPGLSSWIASGSASIISFNYDPTTIQVRQGDSLDPSSIPHIRNWLMLYSKSLESSLNHYCDSILMKDPLNITKKYILASKGDTLIPVIIYAKGNPEVFEWNIEEKRIATDDWVGIPSKTAFKVDLKHKFLNRGITPYDSILIKLPSPVLRPFPAETESPFFSWYVGFIVDGKNIKKMED